MKYSVAVCLMLALLSAAAETPRSVEIRFCPASAIRTYPLESRRDLQSLLLQNVAVINHGSAPFKIENIEIELPRSNRAIESRDMDREAVQRIADRGAKLQAAGILQQVGFQFCGFPATRRLVCGLGSFVSHGTSLGHSGRVCTRHCEDR
ncbi:MAG: hypothetical protein DMF36_00410 [Verrucomicrobia bacterium]|nr:MAG: hypothetical protein DMF36_00410 [Verrucomicrobiota bacterium]